jgi:Protein of unknown function (DUF3224)
MSTHAEGKFKVKSWDEDTYAELGDGRKLTRASVKQGFSGDVEGEGAVEWLMCYRPDETADFVGLQQVDGRVGDRSGSFVLQNSGTFDGREARGEWSVVPGSGTGDLSGLRGEGQFTAPLGGEPSLTLEYDFD